MPPYLCAMPPPRHRITPAEIGFMVLLYGVVFLFYAYDRKSPLPEVHEFVFYLTYAVAAVFIGYYLLPRYVYRGRYGLFAVWVAAIVAGLIAIEELVIEPIYFPDDRALRFPGLVFSVLHVLPTLTILVGGKFGYDAVRARDEVRELSTAVRESELSMLQSQINPHFLFNNLNNLYSYALEGSPKTPGIILELSGVLRYMLYECRARYVPLGRELTQLRNFVRLYEMQIEERGQIELLLPDFVPGELTIAPLILPVFAENAFKHGQSGLAQGIDIHIKAEIDENYWLTFQCRNSYAPATAQQEKGGIGLANVRKRLTLLYPDHKIFIHDDGHTYQVVLAFPLTPLNP